MKSWVKCLILGGVSYLIFVIVQFPADKAYSLAKTQLVEHKIPLALYEVKGSVWQGSASTLIYEGRRFDAFAWEFHPLDLLMGKASVSLRIKGENLALKGKLAKSIMGDILLENTQGNIGADELLKLLKIPAVKLSGEFSVNLPKMTLSDNVVTTLQGRLLWADAESAFPQKLVLGDLYTDFSTTEDGVIHAKLGDGGGALELTGGATVAPDGKYEAKGLSSARAGRQSGLGRSLGFVGRYDAAGKVAFNRSGNISEFGFLIK